MSTAGKQIKQNPQKLYVFIDEHCEFCVKLASRLRYEASYFPLHLLPMRESVQLERFKALAPFVESGRFIVLDERGAVYFDTKARLMVLYALKRYRGMSATLALPEFIWLVEVAFNAISNNRDILSQLGRTMESEERKQVFCEKGQCVR